MVKGHGFSTFSCDFGWILSKITEFFFQNTDQNFSSKIFENFEKMKKYLKRKSRKNSKSRTQRLESKMSKVEIEERKEISIFVLCKHLYSLIQQHVMVFNRYDLHRVVISSSRDRLVEWWKCQSVFSWLFLRVVTLELSDFFILTSKTSPWNLDPVLGCET